MLRLAYSLRELDFSRLMEVYIEGNLEKGDLLQAEQDFYQYLQEGFFNRPGDVYCLWEVDGRCVAALRLQAYHRDGLLLEALETAPAHRRKGYGRALVLAALEKFPEEKVYVHIAGRNKASIALHEGCGFRRISDCAVYADGSVTNRAGTYVYDGKWQRG